MEMCTIAARKHTQGQAGSPWRGAGPHTERKTKKKRRTSTPARGRPNNNNNSTGSAHTVSGQGLQAGPHLEYCVKTTSRVAFHFRFTPMYSFSCSSRQSLGYRASPCDGMAHAHVHTSVSCSQTCTHTETKRDVQVHTHTHTQSTHTNRAHTQWGMGATGGHRLGHKTPEIAWPSCPVHCPGAQTAQGGLLRATGKGIPRVQ